MATNNFGSHFYFVQTRQTALSGQTDVIVFYFLLVITMTPFLPFSP